MRFPGPMGLAAVSQVTPGPETPGAGIRLRGRDGHRPAAAGSRWLSGRRDRGPLNRMGFNNAGAGQLALRLARHIPDVPIGVRISASSASPAGEPSRDASSAWLLGPLAAYRWSTSFLPTPPACATCGPSNRCARSRPWCRPRRPPGAGEDRPGPVRRGRRRRGGPGGGNSAHGHRRHQHHGVACRACALHVGTRARRVSNRLRRGGRWRCCRLYARVGDRLGADRRGRSSTPRTPGTDHRGPRCCRATPGRHGGGRVGQAHSRRHRRIACTGGFEPSPPRMGRHTDEAEQAGEPSVSGARVR